MITLLILAFAMNNYTGGLIVLLAVVAVFGLFMLRRSMKRPLKESVVESLQATNDESDHFIEFEPISEPGPGEYEFDFKDQNCVYSLYNPKLVIRLLKPGVGAKNVNHDQLRLATSLAHRFEKSSDILFKTIPELTSISLVSSHELIICKSPATKFSDLQDSIFKVIFTHLNAEYSWMCEEQEIVITEHDYNTDCLTFDLRVQTFRHLDLGRQLLDLNGIVHSPTNQFPLCMDHEGNYDIQLIKGKAFTWEELLPKIKQIFSDYFTGGVIFIHLED